MQGAASTSRVVTRTFSRPSRPSRKHVTRALAQADRRMVRLTVAGPPDGQPPRVIEVDDPLSSPAELIVTSEIPIQKAGITKSEAREQAAIIQAQREEITGLRRALAETQDVMYKGKSAYNDVVQTKDMQIAQLYELAASGVRERARLRQELSEMQQEMQGTKRQLHAFMASLMQLKSSMDSAAGGGEVEHALELLQSSSWTQSLQGSLPPLSADEDVYMQLVQMQKLSNTLVQDMRQDEELMQQGLEPRSKPASYDSLESFNSLDSVDLPATLFGSKPSSSSSSSSSSKPSSSSKSTASKMATPAAASSKETAPSPAAASSKATAASSPAAASSKAAAAATSPAAAAASPPAASKKAAAPSPAAASSSSSLPLQPRTPAVAPSAPSAPSTPKQPQPQPRAQPAAEPAEEPPSEPAARPAAQPAAKPAAQPAAEPAPEPAAPPPSKTGSNGRPSFFPGLGGNGNSSNGGGGGYYKTWKF